MIGTSFHVFILAYKHDIEQYHICYYSVISDTTHARNAHAYVHVHVFMQHTLHTCMRVVEILGGGLDWVLP